MTQEQNVLQHMISGKRITPLDALKLYGSFRLASVIFKLKEQGYPIQTKIVKGSNGKRFAEYYLEKSRKAEQLEMSI